MKFILCLLGALACCMLLCTCGTARVVADDYEDDIELIDILPDSGISGEQVTFTPVFVEHSGFDDEERYIWLWEFGTGAEPEKFYGKEASVTLRDGIRAPYTGTLTVMEIEGGEEETVQSFPFTFDVVGLDILAVSPRRAVQGSEVTFSAIIGSGVVESYAWDFGGAGTPGGSNEANPTIEITGQPGIYDGSVIISNDFEVFEFPFTFIVDAAPPTE